MATFPKFADEEELKTSETNQDFISNIPTEVIENILKRLPLTMVAKMSVLSKCWREYWLSHRYLIFDREFWIEQNSKGDNYKFNLEKASNIISNILLHHNGPVHTFHLVTLRSYCDQQVMTCYNTSSWVSYLSKNGVKNIIVENNWHICAYIPSHIYACKELVKLKLKNCTMMPPPSDFKGFAYLQTLELLDMKIEEDVFTRLLLRCPQLTMLSLDKFDGMKNIVIDVPNLKHLTIKGVFDSIAFNNVQNLKELTIMGAFDSISFESMECNLCSISIYLRYVTRSTIMRKKDTYNAFHRLASLCKLQHLHFGGHFSQVLAEGCTTKQLTMAFNHLQKLCLTKIDLKNHDVYCFTISMIQRCPLIKDLTIRTTWRRTEINAGQHNLEYDENYKSNHLQRVNISGIVGSDKELKLIEYILASSVVLEKLLVRVVDIDIPSEVKLLHDLLRIPRASSKAELGFTKMYGAPQ